MWSGGITHTVYINNNARAREISFFSFPFTHQNHQKLKISFTYHKKSKSHTPAFHENILQIHVCEKFYERLHLMMVAEGTFQI
jgi:hypothetical protein